jgi:tetratricopeptide (TPR) repeat protein
MLDPLQSARNLRDLDKDAEALPLLEKAAKKYPQSAEVWTLLSLSQNRMGHNDGALRSAERALALEPQNIWALNANAEALTGLKRYEAALDVCNMMAAIESDSSLTMTTKGKVLVELGQFEAALSLYNQALALSPTFVLALLSKSSLLLKLDRKQEGLMVARSAMNIKPDSVLVQTAYILALTASEQYREAMRLVKQTIKENPRDFRPWMAKGAIHSQQGDMNSSSIAWSTASTLNPKNQSLKEEAKAVRKESMVRALGIFGRLLGIR